MSELWRFVYIESHVTLHAKADAQKVNCIAYTFCLYFGLILS